MTANPVFTREQRADLDREENRRLGPEEFEARVRAPWPPREHEHFDDLVRWFCTRYPTPLQRLRAIRNRMVQLRRRRTARASSS
jgi:hypothetical protein